jgi:CheY-like chemotaxis protein
MARILVIDDARFVRDVLRHFLEAAGHEVLEAEDGDQAIGIYQQQTPELVISDVIMPNKDGIETLRELRQINPQIKVIAISGGARSGNLDYLEVARKLGADAILSKPFSRALLLQVVDGVLKSQEPVPKGTVDGRPS